MTRTPNISELVSRAQKGDRVSLGVLSTRVRRRMFVYLYRITLDYHLTEDLVQETVLYMIESLPRLDTQSSSSLWAWIYRSAWGIYHHYLRPQGHQRIVRNTLVDHEILFQLTAGAENSALEYAERAELCEAICKSLGAMKARYRSVLVLRCFERFSYAQIAAVMECSEVRARVIFFHAKHALKRRLQKRGFGRRYFLTGLSLFGMITATNTKSASAAITVTSSMVKTHAIAEIISAITVELSLLKTAAISIAIIAVTICVCTSDADVSIKSTSNITIAEIGDTDSLSNIVTAAFTPPDPCDIDPNEPEYMIPSETGDKSPATEPEIQIKQSTDPNEINNRSSIKKVE